MSITSKKYLTVEEAAESLRVHHNTVRKLLKAKRISGAFHIGGSWRIPADFADRLSKADTAILTSKTTQVAIRLPAGQLEAIDQLVPGTHPSRADVIRRALELYLYRLECERDARIYEAMPLTDEELAFSDDPENWKTMPPW